MHTSLGGIIQASAAFRCGLSRQRELLDWPYFDEKTHNENLFIGHPAAGVSDGFQRIGRLLKIGCYALADMKQYSVFKDLDPLRLGFRIVIPTSYSDQGIQLDSEEVSSFLIRLRQVNQIEVEEKNVCVYPEGSVGTISAIQEAFKLIENGYLDYCLVGAIDSLLDAQRLIGLITTGKIKSVDNPTGLVPGEAACFILIERLTSAKKRGTTSEVVLHQPSKVMSSDERNENDELPTGEKWYEAMMQALKNACTTTDEKGTIYCDLNGDAFRAADFGNALVRLSSTYSLGDWRREIPALSFGDTGAASGLLAACLTIRTFSRGYFWGNKTLISMLSHCGHKGAMVLERIKNGPSL